MSGYELGATSSKLGISPCTDRLPRVDKKTSTCQWNASVSCTPCATNPTGMPGVDLDGQGGWSTYIVQDLYRTIPYFPEVRHALSSELLPISLLSHLCGRPVLTFLC